MSRPKLPRCPKCHKGIMRTRWDWDSNEEEEIEVEECDNCFYTKNKDS